MNQLNQLILEGNVCREFKVARTVNGVYGELPIAVNRFYRGANGEEVNEVSFFDIEVRGRLAELCEKYGKKGFSVRIVGRLRQERWKDQDGMNRSKVCVLAEHVEFLGNKEEGA